MTDLQWQTMEELFKSNPDAFPARFIDKGLFLNVYAQVCSRTFGDTPSSCMIPMADNMNHNHHGGRGETINKSLHPKGEEHPQYFTVSKYQSGYSELFKNQAQD